MPTTVSRGTAGNSPPTLIRSQGRGGGGWNGGRARSLGLVLRERGPGVSLREIEEATGARLIIKSETPEMRLH